MISAPVTHRLWISPAQQPDARVGPTGSTLQVATSVQPASVGAGKITADRPATREKPPSRDSPSRAPSFRIHPDSQTEETPGK